MTNLAERTVDRTFANWVRQRSGSDVLARAAFAASRDEGHGHSCAALSNDADFIPDDLAALRSHPWVGDGATFTPFVLDAAGNFYVWRNWRHETRLADVLRARASARSASINTAADVADLFHETDPVATREQRAAVAAVLGARVFALTGGPGTGKTATVLRMVLMLLRQAESSGFGAAPTIAFAAPTGKAAQRLAQSIGAGKLDLQRRLSGTSVFRSLLAGVPHAHAQTLHRLLGFRPRENTFARGADSPLAADIVVVDETSMVDLATMRQLFDAVRPDATVILVGDPGQLYAVEAGSVLGDIVASADEGAHICSHPMTGDLFERRVESSVLQGRVVALKHVWRADAGLHESLDAVRAGDVAWADRLIKDGDVGAVNLRACTDTKTLQRCVDRWLGSNADTYADIMRVGVDPATALRSIRSAQILCALRDGTFGSHGINALTLRALSKRFDIDTVGEWHHGRPVIVTRNDYARDLYNGDVGIALREDGALRVWFESRDRDGTPALRSFSTRTLPTHEPAWAITIHRSQGSEYERVAVVLPPQPDNRVLSRELIYTAMSRATRSVEVWSSPASLRAAIAQPIHRRGGLRKRLR